VSGFTTKLVRKAINEVAQTLNVNTLFSEVSWLVGANDKAMGYNMHGI